MEQDQKYVRSRRSTIVVQMDEEQLNDFISGDTLTHILEEPTKQHEVVQQDEIHLHRQSGNFNYQTAQFVMNGELEALNQQNFQPQQKKEQPKPTFQKKSPANIQQLGSKEQKQSQPTSPMKPITKSAAQLRLIQQIHKHSLKMEEIQGEVYVNLVKSELYSEARSDVGKLLLTNYRLAFFIGQKNKLDIPYGLIQRVGIKQDKKSSFIIQVYLKYSPVWKFRFESYEAGSLIDSMLNLYIFPQQITDAFAFTYAKHKPRSNKYAYQFFKEYSRIGFLSNPKFKVVENTNGRYCQTYPMTVIIPIQVTDTLLKNVAKCRQRQRFPVATYLYQYEGITSCLWRASQLKANSQKWMTDIEYLTYLSYETRLILIDARSRQTAKNMEAPQLYKQIEIEFANIDLVSTTKAAYLKMIETCLIPNNKKFIKGVGESKWYEQVFSLLKTASRIAELLSNSRNVIVKCSDGWDRTSQLCALSMLMLDPYYRTIEGFEVLVQKQFCSYGEPFNLRLGFRGRSQQHVPIFIQFLDCVSQIMNQYPLSFQFSYKYLSNLAYSAYTNKYGNFLPSCEKQSIDFGVKERTVSVWNELTDYPLSVNPFYSNQTGSGVRQITITSTVRSMRLWKQHFFYLTTNIKDTYKTHPYAEQNDDYILLQHQKLKQQTQYLRKTVSDELKQIRLLESQLKQLNSQREKEEEQF